MKRQPTAGIQQGGQQRPVAAPGFNALGRIAPLLDRLLDGVLLVQHMLELGIAGLPGKFVKDLGIRHCGERRGPTGALGQFSAFFCQ